MVLIRKRRGGRRHKKLKAIDPFYSGSRKLLVDRKLFNANEAPKKGDNVDHKISHRFQQFLDNKKHAEEMQKKSKNKFKQTSNEEKKDEHLEQKPNESDRNYLNRLDDELKFALNCARYETKYNVKLVADKNDPHKVEIQKEKSQRSDKRLKRLKAKKEENKLKKEEKKLKHDDFQLLQDRPKFGDIVHEPPALVLPKRSKIDKSKAGMKDLLLKEKLKSN